MKLFKRLFAREDNRASVRPLYIAVAGQARLPHWYTNGEVPDTIEGRFEMVTLLLSLVLIRLDGLGEAAANPAALLAEIFVEDMDGQLRQLGMGDVVVGKHIGKMMSALGGRLGAYRAGLVGDAPMQDALVRNLYAGSPPSDQALTHVEVSLRSILEALNQRPLQTLLAGDLA
ncbi:MAG: ubiquinol-cytochrome C chaperone family protein [Pseudomonadota bacterium]